MTGSAGPGGGAFAGRSVLVIGGHGFLGRNAARAFAAAGAEVTVLVRAAQAPPVAGATATIVGDMKDLDVARGAVRGRDLILNFAGVTSAVSSNQTPSLSLMEECFPHLNLLAACAEQSVKPLIVFPSSRLVYGPPLRLPVDEEHPTRPNTVYGIHKLTVENYLRVYRQMAGVPYLILRISNPYGPLQHRDSGYGILNSFIRRAVAGQPIRLFGDGGQRRNFMHVDDLMSIILQAARTPECHNMTFDVGGPTGISLRHAAETIAAAAGGTPVLYEPWPAEYLKVETGDFVASLALLARHVALPAFIGFEAGIAATVAAYRAG